ncbi:TonB family protein [Bosea sp. LjRoot90]|uniref:TonB family protein n=1 Tax=Bosea sp. LjRoot90 TaxID=3342342 RepID=UPI003ECDC873
MIASAPDRRWLAALRWGAAALTVATLHGGLAWVGVHWRPTEAAAGAPEPAVMIELAALSVAPEAPLEELPVAPERAEPEPPPPEPIKETPPPEPEPEPVPEPIPVEQPEVKLPELPQIPKLDAVLLPPPPELKPVEKKPPPKVVEKKKEKPKPRVVERKPVERRAPEAVAPKPSEQRAAAPTSAAQGSASQPTVSTASWRGSLIAHLNRYKRFPGGASPGTVQVAFAIDRSGNVLSSRVVGSSGDSALDAEAAAMIRRASPVPAPPAGVGGGGAISLSVPIRFSR